MTDVEPCPFCGSNDIDARENSFMGHFVKCCECDGMMLADSRAGAIAGWNTRNGWRDALEAAAGVADERAIAHEAQWQDLPAYTEASVRTRERIEEAEQCAAAIRALGEDHSR